jgi:hypothetical protein
MERVGHEHRAVVEDPATDPDAEQATGPPSRAAVTPSSVKAERAGRRD